MGHGFRRDALPFGTVCVLESIAAFGDRLWLFSIPILFIQIWPGDLLPIAVYNLVLYVCLFLIMPYAGAAVDAWPRMRLMATTIALDNAFVVLACALTFACSYYPDDEHTLRGLLGGIIACSIVAQFFAGMGTMALEKDWVPAIAKGDRSGLARLNAWLRRIDLTCKFAAPTLFGVILQSMGSDRARRVQIGSIFVGMWNLVSLFPELWLSYSLYRDYRCLRRAKDDGGSGASRGEPSDADTSGEALLDLAIADDAETNRSGRASTLECCAKLPVVGPFVSGWGAWWGSEVTGMTLAYSLLYGTVLAPGPLITGYLEQQGVPDGVLGLSMGLGAAFGLLGTLLYPPMAARMALPSVGLITIWLWCLFLIPVVGIFFARDNGGVDGSAQSAGYAMLFFVTSGRVWLWAYDLAETQTLQEWVPEAQRGRVSGVQSALCTLWTLAVYGASVYWSRVQDFGKLVYLSFAFVLLGAVVHALWFCRHGNRTSAEREYLNLQDQFMEMEGKGQSTKLDGDAGERGGSGIDFYEAA